MGDGDEKREREEGENVGEGKRGKEQRQKEKEKEGPTSPTGGLRTTSEQCDIERLSRCDALLKESCWKMSSEFGTPSGSGRSRSARRRGATPQNGKRKTMARERRREVPERLSP